MFGRCGANSQQSHEFDLPENFTTFQGPQTLPSNAGMLECLWKFYETYETQNHKATDHLKDVRLAEQKVLSQHDLDSSASTCKYHLWSKARCKNYQSQK